MSKVFKELDVWGSESPGVGGSESTMVNSRYFKEVIVIKYGGTTIE